MGRSGGRQWRSAIERALGLALKGLLGLPLVRAVRAAAREARADGRAFEFRPLGLMLMSAAAVALGLLAGSAVPALNQRHNRSKREICYANLRSIGLSINLYAGEEGRLPPDLYSLVAVGGAGSGLFVCPFPGATEPRVQ